MSDSLDKFFDSKPEGFWENALDATKTAAKGLGNLVTTVGEGAATFGMGEPGAKARQALTGAAKDIVAAPYRELMGRPQPGTPDYIPSKDIPERLGSAIVSIMGGDPNKVRAAVQRGDMSGATAQLITGPLLNLGLSKLLGATFGVRSPNEAKSINKIAAALETAGDKTPANYEVIPTFERAIPLIKNALSSTGMSVPKTLKEFTKLVNLTKDNAVQTYNKYIGPIANTPIEASSVATAIRQAITPDMKKEASLGGEVGRVARNEINAINEQALKYQSTPWTLGELDAKRSRVNDPRRSTLAKDVSEKSNALLSAENHEIDAIKELTRTQLDQIYNKPGFAQSLGLPVPKTSFAELQRNISTLIDLRDMAELADNRTKLSTARKLGKGVLESGTTSPSVSATKRGLIFGTHNVQRVFKVSDAASAASKVSQALSEPRFGSAKQLGTALAGASAERTKKRDSLDKFFDDDQ